MKYIISESKMKDLIVEYIKFYFKDYEFQDWVNRIGTECKVMRNEKGDKLLLYNIESNTIFISSKVVYDISNVFSIDVNDIYGGIFRWLEEEYNISARAALNLR